MDFLEVLLYSTVTAAVIFLIVGLIFVIATGALGVIGSIVAAFILLVTILTLAIYAEQ